MSFIDYQKKIPVYGDFEVCVLGGGPAGVCAALEAARNGRRVLLCESTGMLGGSATSSLVGPFMTCYDRDGNKRVVGGLFDEIIDRTEKFGGAISPDTTDSPSIYTSFIQKYHRRVAPFDSFALQTVLDDMMLEAGVHVLLYTKFADSITENGRITSIVLDAPQGLIAVTAKVFIDGTGNADVAAASGVRVWFGHEDGLPPQPATLFFEVSGADDDVYFGRPQKPVKAYRMPQKGCYKVNHERVYGVNANDADSMTAAHMKGRKQVLESYDVLLHTKGFENCRIMQVASTLGVRESRHIEGRYMLTVKDLAGGVVFPDAIASLGYGMDVHTRDGSMKGGFHDEVANVYTIPYRSLLPVGCDNLIVAGKTVCAESQAAGAIRIMPGCMAMGQAAGCAAAMAIDADVDPADVDVADLRAKLREHGALIVEQ